MNQTVLKFFENVEKYYGSKTEITETICSDPSNYDRSNSTWNLSEFDLIRSGYRNDGNRFMIEGSAKYLEISASNIIAFTQLGRNKFEFIEQYGEFVFRVISIRFHYKY